MTANTQIRADYTELDLVAIQREARAMQAQALAEMFRSLRRSVAALFTRGSAARTA